MQKTVLAVSAAVMLVIAGAAVWILTREEPAAPRSQWLVQADGAGIGGPFELTDQTGARVTEREVIDGPTLVYFGYTFCPDVCPIDTQIMIDAVERLDAQGIAVDPVFVTVDPARDTVEALGHYAEAFHPRMTALTGTDEEIRAAARAYKVYYERVETEGASDYLMNHTAFLYFMMPDGLAALFRHGVPAEELAGEIARILSARGATG